MDSVVAISQREKTFEAFENLEGFVRSRAVDYRHLPKKAMESTAAFHNVSTSASAWGNSTPSHGWPTRVLTRSPTTICAVRWHQGPPVTS